MKPSRSILPLALLIGLLACSNKGDSVKAEPGSQTPADISDAQTTRAPSPQASGTAPVLGPDGVPTNCPILYDGLCYQETSDACQAAECPDEDCSILESYPGQVACAKVDDDE